MAHFFNGPPQNDPAQPFGPGAKNDFAAVNDHGRDNFSVFFESDDDDDEEEEEEKKAPAKHFDDGENQAKSNDTTGPAPNAAAATSSLAENDLGPIDQDSDILPPSLPPTLKRLNTLGREEELRGLTTHYAVEMAHLVAEAGDGVDEGGGVGVGEGEGIMCAPLEGLREMNSFYHKHKYQYAHSSELGNGEAGAPAATRKIMRELVNELPKALVADARGTIFVRYDSVYPRYLRALITGSEGTVYSSGIFMFDIYLQTDYPNTPLNIVHVTKGANTVHASHSPGGFSPNLHQDSGKVCLSLLGTWKGKVHMHTHTLSPHRHTHTHIHTHT